MPSLHRPCRLALAIVAALALPIFAAAQQQRSPRRDPPPGEGVPRTAEPRRAAAPEREQQRRVAGRGEVIFIGGYFYDPHFGPYPWWPRPVRHPWYFPVYDYRAEVRVMVTPRDAAVYVDGYYAGVVDDFDGVFQHLLLPPGGHVVALNRPGFRSTTFNIYLAPGSTMKLRQALEPLPPGAMAEPPPFAPPIPPPPPGSYRLPPAPSVPLPAAAPAAQAVGFGRLELRMQPLDATVRVDDEVWTIADSAGYLAIDLAVGRHRLEVAKPGYVRYQTTIEVREGMTTPVNVSLPPERR